MKINNLYKTCNPKTDNQKKNNTQSFKNNNSSDYIYAKQTKFEAIKIPAAAAILLGHTFLENNEVKFKQKFNDFKNKTGGKLNLALLCAGCLVLTASCLHSYLNEKDEEKNVVYKVKKEKNEREEKTLKKYLLKKAFFDACTCSTLNIVFSFFNIKKIGNKTCEKALGYGVGSGLLWMGISLLANKLTLDKFKKENSQEISG